MNAHHRQFGEKLREWRKSKSLTLDQVASLANLSKSTLSKLEGGQRSTALGNVERLDHLYEAGGELVQAWQESRERAADPPWLNVVRESEDRATEIRNWHPYLLPGLLQTPRYAEILIGHGSPGEKPETVAALAKARCERLGQLRAEFRAVISESALRSAVGSAAIMSEQLQHLLDVGDRARIQVLPSSCGFFGGLTGSFRLLSFADRTPRVECEHAGGSVLVSDAAEVRRLTSVFSELSGWAYDFRTSSELIREVMHGYAVEEE